MYSTKQRKLAIETYIKFDLSAADTVAELGYPTRHSPRAWHRDYLEHGEVRPPKRHREPWFTLWMRQAAVDYHLAHGKSLAGTMRKMGYPASREHLCDWIDELAPGQGKCRGPNPEAGPVPPGERMQAVAELESRNGTAAEAAAGHGAPGTAPCIWRGETMGDDAGDTEKKGVPASKGLDDLPGDIEVLRDMPREAKMRLRKVRLEPDARQATPRDSKKDPGADPGLLTSEEKAAMAEALRAGRKPCEIPPVAGMAKSGASTPGTPRPKARPKGAPQRGRRSSGRSGPAAAHTATGASPPWQAPASGRLAASWGTRARSPAPPGRGGATARARARSPRRPRTRCATRGASDASGPTGPAGCGSPT